MKNTPLRRVGKKNWWIPLRAKAKVAFESAGVTTCEVRRPGCWRDNALGFCHSLKRRNIHTEEEKREVILGCNICHDALELLPEDVMYRTVREIILRRPVKIVIP